MRTEDVKAIVRRRYGSFAASGGAGEACCAAQPAPDPACDLGAYTAGELARVPRGALELSRGCGNPTGFAELRPGEVVVDFGCGGGIDLILAAHRVAPGGRVVGVDFTAPMVEAAARHLGEAGLADGTVELVVADLEDTGLPGGEADVIISNCVVNLCPDKEAVYREAYRLLRPGGRLAISDVVLTGELSTQLVTSFSATWAGCLGGAVAGEQYFGTLRTVGFETISIVADHRLSHEELGEMPCCPGPEFTPRPDEADLAAVEGRVTSIKFTAVKPGTTR